jgi:hypothetical protein
MILTLFKPIAIICINVSALMYIYDDVKLYCYVEVDRYGS